MRMLFIAVMSFVIVGLPLHAAVTNPFVTDISGFIREFASVAAVLIGFSTVFAVAALALGRAMSGVWLWNDVVLVHRRSRTTARWEAIRTAQEVADVEHQRQLKEELDAKYVAWLFHK